MELGAVRDEVARAEAAVTAQRAELVKLARQLADARADAEEAVAAVEAAQSASHSEIDLITRDLKTTAGRAWLNIATGGARATPGHEPPLRPSALLSPPSNWCSRVLRPLDHHATHSRAEGAGASHRGGQG